MLLKSYPVLVTVLLGVANYCHAAPDAQSPVPALIGQLGGADVRKASMAAMQLAGLPRETLIAHQQQILAAGRQVAQTTAADPTQSQDAQLPTNTTNLLLKLGPTAGPQAIPVLEELLAAAPRNSAMTRAMTAYGPDGVAALGRILSRFDPFKPAASPDAAFVSSSVCSTVIHLGPDASPLVKQISALLKSDDIHLRTHAVKALASIGKAAASAESAVRTMAVPGGRPQAGPEATLVAARDIALRRMSGGPSALPRNFKPLALPRSAGGVLSKEELARDRQMLRFILTNNGFLPDAAGWAALGDAQGVRQSLASFEGTSRDAITLSLIHTLLQQGNPLAVELLDQMEIACLGSSAPSKLLIYKERWTELAAVMSETDGDVLRYTVPEWARLFDHATVVKCLDLVPARSQFGQDLRSPAWLAYGLELLANGETANAVEAFERAATSGWGTDVGEDAMLCLAALTDGARVVAIARQERPHSAEIDHRPPFNSRLDIVAGTLAYRGDMKSARAIVEATEKEASRDGRAMSELAVPRSRHTVLAALIRSGDADATRAWLDESSTVIATVCRTRHSAGRLRVAASLAGTLASGYRSMNDEKAARKVLSDAAKTIDAERGVPLTPPPNAPRDGRMPQNMGVGGDPFGPGPVPQAAPRNPEDVAPDNALAELALMQHALGYTDDGHETVALIRHRIKQDSIEQDLAKPNIKQRPAILRLPSSDKAYGAGHWRFELRSNPPRIISPQVEVPTRLPIEPVVDRLANLTKADRLESWQETEVADCISVLGRREDQWEKAANGLADSKRPLAWLTMLAQERAKSGDARAVAAIFDRAVKFRNPTTPPGSQDVTAILDEADCRIQAGDKAGAMKVLRATFPRGGPALEATPPGPLDRSMTRACLRLGEVWTYASDAVSAWQYAEGLPADSEARRLIKMGVVRALQHRLTGRWQPPPAM